MSLTRLLPSLFSTATAQKSLEPGNINSIVLGAKLPSGGREVWTLIDTRVQKWSMHPEGWEELILDRSVLDHLTTALESFLGSDNTRPTELDLELLDLAIDE
jgi:nuclear pore complex protein Nup133